MNKTKSLVLQCIGVFVAFLGIWWWVGREYKKTHPVKEVEQGIIGGGKMTKIMELEIKVREIGLFFLANSGRLADAVEKLDMEEELETLLESFQQILEEER